MQQCSETITVINRKLNATTGLDDWTPTVITGASWFSKLVASVTQAGLKAADTVTVRIPTDADTQSKSYMEPKAYEAAKDVSGAWTLAHGDIIVRGAVTVRQGESLKPADITRAYDECMTIISSTNNTRRPHGAHWKVVGA